MRWVYNVRMLALEIDAEMTLTCAREGPVAVVDLDRADAMDLSTAQGWSLTFDALAKEPTVWAVLLCGFDERVLWKGVDLWVVQCSQTEVMGGLPVGLVLHTGSASYSSWLSTIATARGAAMGLVNRAGRVLDETLELIGRIGPYTALAAWRRITPMPQQREVDAWKLRSARAPAVASGPNARKVELARQERRPAVGTET